MITNFRHVCFIVKDLKRSLRFYRDILGLKVSKKVTVKGAYPDAVFNRKGINLTYVKLMTPEQGKHDEPVFELHYWQKPRIMPKKGYHHISFTINNLDDEYNRLKKLGVKFMAKPVQSPNGKTKICFASDSDGNLIEFIEDINKKHKPQIPNHKQITIPNIQ